MKGLNFKEIDEKIKPTYYNSEDDTIRDFLIPILKRCKIYKRETYSFSSAIFSLISRALSDLIKNECKIKYIVGFELGENEIKAIEAGLEDEKGIIEKKIRSEFGNIENLIRKMDRYSQNVSKYRLTILSYMISKKLLEIKVGFVRKRGRIRNPSKFKFHPKVMIFEDFEGNVIVGNGSTNESFGAHVRNEEAFDTFKSWNPKTKEYYDSHVEKFDEFWENNSDNIKTLDISTILESDLLADYKRKFKDKEEIIKIEQKLDRIFNEENRKKSSTGLWEHQRRVIEDWFNHECKGLIKFATGSGKTLTALSAMNQLFEEKRKLFTVISTPYQALSEQWQSEITKKFQDYEVLLAYQSKDNWYKKAHKLVNSFKTGRNNKLIFVTVNKTLVTEPFLSLIKKIQEHKLLIADEVHQFATKPLDILSDFPFTYKIGLSATPECEDPQKTERLFKFFGGLLSPEFTLKDALNEGILCKYDYKPILVELQKDEEGRYWAVSDRIQKTLDENKTSEKLQSLMNERSEILNTASQKIVKLDKMLRELGPDKINSTFIYCHNKSHLEKVASVLYNLNIRAAKITSSESAYERKKSFESFKNNESKVLLAIRCLDEGIDIPAVDTAFVLASSSNPRQFIQRRGRLLRKMRDKPGNVIEKTAVIYDFVSFPVAAATNNYEKTIVSKEIKRIEEFAELSSNKKEAMENVKGLKTIR